MIAWKNSAPGGPSWSSRCAPVPRAQRPCRPASPSATAVRQPFAPSQGAALARRQLDSETPVPTTPFSHSTRWASALRSEAASACHRIALRCAHLIGPHTRLLARLFPLSRQRTPPQLTFSFPVLQTTSSTEEMDPLCPPPPAKSPPGSGGGTLAPAERSRRPTATRPRGAGCFSAARRSSQKPPLTSAVCPPSPFLPRSPPAARDAVHAGGAALLRLLRPGRARAHSGDRADGAAGCGGAFPGN